MTPLRFAVGWNPQPRWLGLGGVVTLILLRLTIGWHFFGEGYDKYQQGNWDSRPFFVNAKGPFAGHFRGLIWDADGDLRQDVEKTKQTFASFREHVARQYRFNDVQKQKGQQLYADAVKQLEVILANHAEDLDEIRHGRQRLIDLENDRHRAGVASLAGQTDTIRSDYNGKLRPILAQIDTVWTRYEAAQNSVATLNQADARGYQTIAVPRTGLVDTSVLNQVVPYLDMLIGICLVIGLFTPAVSLAACGFLFSVVLSQLPPTSGPGSSNYQLIEGMACLVLAGTGAGRFAGLDFVLHTFIQKFWPRAAE